MSFGVEVVTDRRVALRFDEFPQKAHARLLEVITRATEELRGAVQAAAPKRTGRLASEIYAQVTDGANRITGLVGIRGETGNDFAKAAAEEYGAHGRVSVRQHAMRLNHVYAAAIAPTQVLVAAYSRQANITARNFLRGPLHAMQDEVIAQMRAAVMEAATE